MITLQSGVKSIRLPSPVFNDTMNLNRTVITRKMRSGKLITYLRGASAKRDFVLTFQDVSPANFRAYNVFYNEFATQDIDYIDIHGYKWRVILLADTHTASINTTGKSTTFVIRCQEV